LGAGLAAGDEQDFPPGVVATARTDGETTFVFLQNYSAQQHTISLPQGYQDCLSAARPVALVLTPWDCRILVVRRNPAYAPAREQAFFILKIRSHDGEFKIFLHYFSQPSGSAVKRS
jgi:hypothetical protein